MADDPGIFKWEMASRIILKGLPGIDRSGYATLRNPEAINPYEWNVLYLEPVIKRITTAVARQKSESLLMSQVQRG